MATMNALIKLKSFNINLLMTILVSSNFISMINSKSNSHLVFLKTTIIEFFFQDQVSGRHPTAVPILKPNISKTFFGNLVMIDDALTVDKDPKSKVVGRAQGMYAGASLETNKTALLMVMNFVFTDNSDYNGSTLAMLGRNDVLSGTREMPIIGGTGAFRYAQGFAQANTVWFNRQGDATVHYNITVSHY